MEGYFIVIPDIHSSETIGHTTFILVLLVCSLRKLFFFFLILFLRNIAFTYQIWTEEEEEIKFLMSKCQKRKSTQQLGKGVNRSEVFESLSAAEMLLLGSAFYQHQTAEAVACP